MLFPGSNHSIKKRAYMADVHTHMTFAVIEDDDVAINLSIRLSIEFCKSMVEKTPANFVIIGLIRQTICICTQLVWYFDCD